MKVKVCLFLAATVLLGCVCTLFVLTSSGAVCNHNPLCRLRCPCCPGCPVRAEPVRGQLKAPEERGNRWTHGPGPLTLHAGEAAEGRAGGRP